MCDVANLCDWGLLCSLVTTISFLQESSGITPLMALSAHDKPEIVKQLVSIGADWKVKDSSGKTPLDLATSVGSKETVDFLESLSSAPMDEEERELNRKDLLESVLGENLLGKNTTKDEAHNKYRMWTAVESINCQIGGDGRRNTWGINANNIFCAKDCTGVDLATKESYAIKVGMSRTLGEVPGSVWHDADGEEISSVKCLVGDVGGFDFVGYEEYHQLVANPSGSRAAVLHHLRCRRGALHLKCRRGQFVYPYLKKTILNFILC